MKTAIIIISIITALSGLGYFFTKNMLVNNPIEVFKMLHNMPSVIGGICGLFRISLYVFGCVLAILLLIYLL
jgi:hypothetical protein